MKVRGFAVLAALAFPALSSAQEVDAQCPPGVLGPGNTPDNTMAAQDACQKAIDLFKYMAPQLGMLLAGGNPTQGITGALGQGNWAIGLRANAMMASLPEIDRVVPNPRGAQRSNYTLQPQPLGYVTADAAVGLHDGSPEHGFGTFDVLASLAFLPNYSTGAVQMKTSSPVRLGFGARLGILRETKGAPGVSVSYLTRQLPRVTITGTSGEDSLMVNDLRMTARTWRVVVGKRLGGFGLAGGYGSDSYRSEAEITVSVAERGATVGGRGGPIDLSQRIRRTNLFGSIWLGSGPMRLVGEFGRVSGGSIETYNTFVGLQPDDPRHYVSVGISLGRQAQPANR